MASLTYNYKVLLPLLVVLCFSLCRTVLGEPGDAGSLVKVTFSSTVGVNLNEAQELGQDFVDRFVEFYKTRSGSYWQKLAFSQIQHTTYRQVYRMFYYPPEENMQSLTLTPEAIQEFEFDPSGPSVRDFHGFPHLAWDFTFEAYLLSSEEEPARSDARLNVTGGIVEESYWLPVDPEYVLQRSGYACLDENEYPLNSVFSENTFAFFDDQCGVETEETANCHVTVFPEESCVDSLKAHMGAIQITMQWERVAWDVNIANEWRHGDNSFEYAEKTPYPTQDSYRIVWRYFGESACELLKSEGGCVKSPGWRRILMFTSSSINIGKTDLKLGDVDDAIFEDLNIFEYSDCHRHFHFRGYADYAFAGKNVAYKAGFCLQDTMRQHNNEYTPLASHFPTCQIQGGSPGWNDDYYHGVPCNWLDITTFDAGTFEMTQTLNPDGLICEGKAITDIDGNFEFEQSNVTDSDGNYIWKIKCELNDGWRDNNEISVNVDIPSEGSMTTLPCLREQSGPLRDCGFTVLKDRQKCTPGRTVYVHLEPTENVTTPHVVRICETSNEHQTSTTCEYYYALANEMVTDTATLSFTCPKARSSKEKGGLFSVMAAPVLVSDVLQGFSIRFDQSSDSIRNVPFQWNVLFD